MNEVWKPIKGYKRMYFVSNLGKIMNSKGTILAQKFNRNGYYRVRLFLEGTPRRLMVHRLVAECFKRNSNKVKIVNHKDGDKINNCATNLEWVTQSDNVKHAWKTGLIKRKSKRKCIQTTNTKK